MLILEITRDFVESYCPAKECTSFSEYQLRCNLDDPLYYQVAREISQFVFYTINVRATSHLHMVSAAASIMSILLDRYGCEPAQSVFAGSYSRQRIVRTLWYINENYMEKITLKDIADYVGVHPPVFFRIF